LRCPVSYPSGDLVKFDAEQNRRLIEAVAESVIGHAEELTALDQAIGDGDHGLNMKRGFEAVMEDLESLAPRPLPDLLKAVGTKLVMTIGGASGPLYGTLFLELGKKLPAEPSLPEAAAAFAAAIAAVKTRGKSDTGQKTLLDVLVPAYETLDGGGSAAAVKMTALQAADATIPMKAIRGRAAFLGDRSIGHMDPGARSASLMIAVLCDQIGEA
jgi:phosphoenolpyruvate---glycerone phosphotransferase subunit DhaL